MGSEMCIRDRNREVLIASARTIDRNFFMVCFLLLILAVKSAAVIKAEFRSAFPAHIPWLADPYLPRDGLPVFRFA